MSAAPTDRRPGEIDAHRRRIAGEKLGTVSFGLDGWHLDFDGHAFAVWSRVAIIGPDG